MSDDNETTTADTPTQSGDLPEWAKAKVSSANNEAAKYRVELRSKTDELTAALNKVAELSAEIERLQSELTSEKSAGIRTKVAIEAGVPGERTADFAKLLQGDTEDELKAHASSLLEMFTLGGKPNKPATDPTQGKGDVSPSRAQTEGGAYMLSRLQGIRV